MTLAAALAEADISNTANPAKRITRKSPAPILCASRFASDAKGAPRRAPRRRSEIDHLDPAI
jgi:hypothetical protein